MHAINGNLQVPPTSLHKIAGDAMEAFAIILSKDMQVTVEQFYGFSAEEVSDIHLRKNGHGTGLWFRLRDGRVYDLRGIPSESGREWYGTTVH